MLKFRKWKKEIEADICVRGIYSLLAFISERERNRVNLYKSL